MILFIILLCIAGLLLLIVLYSRCFILIKKFPSINQCNYFPKVAVFLPCKNNFKTLKSNLYSVLNQDYKGDFKVFFIVEEENDPACTVIKEILTKNKRGELIIAGKAEKCSQKNHNIVYTIRLLKERNEDDYEVYAFFDSDHYAPINWLKTLVQTLTIENVEIATLHSLKEPEKIYPFGTMCYAMLLNYICNFNVISNQAWGGSLAMKKETYIKYNIEEIWANSVSHDCPLNGIKAKILFNPTCSPVETEYSYTLKNFIKWTTRQFTNWKYFSLGFWCLSFFSILFNLIIFYSFIATFLLAFLYKFNALIPVILSVYILLSYVIVSLFISFRAKRKIYWFFLNLIFMPLFLNITFISFVRSIFNKKIKWANKSYIIIGKGRVSSITEIVN